MGSKSCCTNGRYKLKSKTDFWLKKLESNVIHDIQVESDLELWGSRLHLAIELAREQALEVATIRR